MMCLHISAPIVSNDLVTAKQPCNFLSQLSTCMDVEHSLCVQVSKQVQTHIVCSDRCVHAYHVDLTQTVVFCRCTYGVQLAGHMSKLCLPNCTYITITTVTIHRLAFYTGLNSLAFMLWCSGAISSVCIPASYVLTLLPITFTTDVHGQT